MSEKHHIIPVWFFVGITLLVYGILIFVSGLMEWSDPPGNIVLANLHAPIWWGALLIILGGLYCIMFRPKKSA